MVYRCSREPITIIIASKAPKNMRACHGSMGSPSLVCFGLRFTVSSIHFSCCFMASLFSTNSLTLNLKGPFNPAHFIFEE